MMLHNIFTLNYNPTLIKNMANDLLKKSIISLIILATFIVYILYDYVPHAILTTWYISHLLFLTVRGYLSYQLIKTEDSDTKQSRKLLLYTYITAFFVGSSWGIIPWVSFVYAPSFFNVILIILTGLLLGSMGTLISIFTLLFVFNTTVLFITIGGFLLFQPPNHLYFALFYFLLYFVFISSTYNYYNTLKNSLLLKEALESLNQSLEEQVKDEVHKNKLQQELLFRQSRMAQMGEMIGNIAHQWRQPLNALNLVIQNIYYLHVDNELNEQQLKHSMDKANRLTNSMSKTIDDFRNFYSDDKEEEEFNIAQSIEKAIEIIEASYAHNNIYIEKRLNTNLTYIGHSSELSQVILNLLSNAKDALISNKINNPYVTLSLYKSDSSITITVEDNGGGIADNIIGKIFDPYFSTKKSDEGVGVGLYMSRQIIHSMNGSLLVSNQNDGAQFKILLDEMESVND